MRRLLLAVVVLSGCDLLFPFTAAHEDRGAQDQTPGDRPGWLDIARSGDLGRRETRPGERFGSTDRRVADLAADAKTLDGKTGPADLAKSDSKPGACLSWAEGWVCPSNEPDFCAAYCSDLQITCADAAGKCRCDNTVTKASKICSNPITGYCQDCKAALASSCCQGL